MANFNKLFQEEVRRLARKETKSDLDRLRAENAELKRLVAQIRKQLGDVERLSRRAAKESEKVAAKVSEPAAEETSVRPRISSKTIMTLRQRLGLTQAELGKLLGVSGQSVYQWENRNGRLNLRKRTAMSVHAMKGIGAREARRRLEEMSG